MKLSVSIDRGEGPEVVKVSPLAFIGWERMSGRRMSDLAGGGLGMLDLAQLAMEQERLEGKDTPATVEEYLAGVEQLDPEVEDPTQPGKEA